MSPCGDCAYRRDIPGNAHSRCVFDFTTAAVAPPAFTGGPRQVQWFVFPFNYDPCWGGDCAAHAEAADPALVMPHNPLADLMMLLGGRL